MRSFINWNYNIMNGNKCMDTSLGAELYNTICAIKDKSAVKNQLKKTNSDALGLIDSCKKGWFSSQSKPYEGQFDNYDCNQIDYAIREIENASRVVNYNPYREANAQRELWNTPLRGFGGGKKTRKKGKRAKTRKRRRRRL